MEYLKYIVIYFIAINTISFAMFYIDKSKAKRDKWRIKENTLHLTSFLGGSAGSIAAMVLFHHKTRKLKFCAITAGALLFNIYAVYRLYGFLM
jgi:uncharacterized membrane protein YsdA (DUF1294 family)